MSPIKITRTINSPANIVFNTVADISQFSEAIPHITKVEFLTDQKSGVGTRFIETRLMRGKEASTELEVTEYVENERIRLVTDNHGSVWDTVFTVSQQGEKTELVMIMDSKPYKLIPKLTYPLIKGIIAKAVESDMDSVKQFCEQKVSD
ncbi:SRPBCC family protein [Aliikangiella coralliicola]|uniref:SRPBCC family protein n=1 Tax=Aliikangiella coralliicola TaxID=2592383 RepID=A0A545UEC3_9GAMM|nr:SRPBCC family protein [Aliikangiella coralliicola]TQV87733.1 hypothetical protein FLL46_10125 [Aliikangiella coralliicola]